MAPGIYYGARSRMRYARRIREAQARGAFADMNTPQNKFRFRRLAILMLVGVLGMILSVTTLLLRQVPPSDTSYGLILVVAVLFGMITTIASFLMQREINRRL